MKKQINQLKELENEYTKELQPKEVEEEILIEMLRICRTITLMIEEIFEEEEDEI